MIAAIGPVPLGSGVVAPSSGSSPVLLAAAVLVVVILAITVWLIRPRRRPPRAPRTVRDPARTSGRIPASAPSPARADPDPAYLTGVLRAVAAQAPDTILRQQIELVLFNPEHTQAQLVQTAIWSFDQLGSDPDQLRPQLLMGLNSVGVEEIRVDAGEPLDAARHLVIDVEHAPAPHLHNTVARSIRPGFRHRGELLRTPGVIAYRQQPA